MKKPELLFSRIPEIVQSRGLLFVAHCSHLLFAMSADDPNIGAEIDDCKRQQHAFTVI
jgi:hypothetical protein